MSMKEVEEINITAFFFNLHSISVVILVVAQASPLLNPTEIVLARY